MLILSIALMVVTLTAFLGAPFAGWLLAFAVKPIVDAAWSEQIFGFSPLELMGAAVPAILIVRMLLVPGDRPRNPPLAGIWLAYGVTIVIGAALYALGNDYIAAASFLFRTLNGIVAFFSLQAVVHDRERLRLLVLALLVSGVFPLATGVYEAVTGDYWRLRLGSGGQIRIAGMYHNSINLKYAAYMTLTAIAIYWSYFSRRRTLSKVLLALYAFAAGIVLFKIYSKAAFLAVGVGVLAWIFMGRRIGWPTVIVVAILAVNAVTENTVVFEVQRSFNKEFMALEGEVNEDTAFGGRLGWWRRQFGDFQEQDISGVLFGGFDTQSGRSAKGGGHNDYIRALMQTGVVGLAAYLLLLVSSGVALYRLYRRRRTPFNLIVLVVFASWMIETLGLTPSLYPSFQWFVWGLVGLALAGVRGLDPEPVRPATVAAGGADPALAPSGVAARYGNPGGRPTTSPGQP